MGDFLSRQYAGTDSTISRVSRDGKEGFYGKLDHKAKVAQRFMMNSLVENSRQVTIDVLLARSLKSKVSSESALLVQRTMKELEDQYTKVQSFKTAAFNLDNASGLNAETIAKITNVCPDLILIGLQNTASYKATAQKI